MIISKKTGIFLLILVFSISLTACMNDNVEETEYTYTIDKAIAYIEEAGFKVSNRTNNFHEMINAKDGANIDVGEEKIPVELYIDEGNIQESMFENPDEGKQAFIVSNLYVYIHSDDNNFYKELKSVFIK